jgi:hypothetical protein
MEHVRLNLVTTDPARLDDATKYLEHEAKDVIEQEPGSLGLSVSVNELGVAIIASYWVSGDAMRESEGKIAPLRDEVLERGLGTVSTEHLEVASTMRVARPHAGGGVRLTRADVDPKRVDEAIAGYEDTALPWYTETDGFCRALLFVDRRRGRAISETIWRDAAALVGSRSADAAIRVDAVAATGAEIRALEEYRVVFNSSSLG